MILIIRFYFILFTFIIQLVDSKNTEILQIKIVTPKQRNSFQKFERNYSKSFDYETLDSTTIQASNLSAEFGWKLKNYLYENRIPFNEIQKRVSKLNSDTNSHPFEYANRHMSFKEILKMLIKWRDIKDKNYKNKIELLEIGRTFKNRPIVVARVTDNVHEDHNRTKTNIFIESGIHAREWASVDTALYMINEMIFENYFKDALKKYVFHFLIILNPDGYIHTWTTNRWWRKNLRPLKKLTSCTGVDLNRNFDVNFSSTVSKACSEDYKGPKAFSEKESQAERDYIKELIDNGHRIDLFLAFHSYGQQITYPYGYSPKKIANWRESHDLLKKVIQNLELYNGIDYNFGQTYHVIYPAAGGSDDWVCHNSLARFTFVMELRDKGNYGFFIPENKIEDSALDGLVTLNTILNHLSPGIIKVRKPTK